MKEEKKNNAFVDFILAFIYIPVYALRGIKFILFDIWVLIFNYLSWQLEKTVNGVTKKEDNSREENERMYQKTKGKVKKNEELVVQLEVKHQMFMNLLFEMLKETIKFLKVL